MTLFYQSICFYCNSRCSSHLTELSRQLYISEEIEESSDGCDSGSKKCKWCYGGVSDEVCSLESSCRYVWQESGFSDRECILTEMLYILYFQCDFWGECYNKLYYCSAQRSGHTVGQWPL
jgi:hypothetical protein